MGKKRHPRLAAIAAPRVADAAPNRDAVSQDTGFSNLFYLPNNGFQAAGNSPNRGYIYWPMLDTKRQISRWTRYEIARKIQFLYNHFGFIRRLVNGLATMLGYLVPQPDTSDEEWNDLALSTFLSIAGSAQVWDIAGKFDFFSGQISDNKAIVRDGDILAVKTMGPGGRARLSYYEAHQLKNPTGAGKDWHDGVQSINGRHIAYGIQDGDDPGQITVIEAWKCIYMADFENRGQIRPLSILAAAVLNMVDVIEVRGFNKTKIKNSSRLGTVIESAAVSPPNARTGGFGGPTTQTTALMPDGTTQTINMELVLNGGQTPNLAPGQTVKVISDDNPSQNNREFEVQLLKDCCHTANLSYERLCDLTQLTGPALRMLNADEKRFVKLKHYEQTRRVHPQVIYTLAIEMDAGRLRKPKLRPGENWMQCFQYIGLASPDIDGGRTAASTLTDLRSGQTTWLETWGQKGVYWKKGVRQVISEYIFALTQCMKMSAAAGLPDGMVTPERVFPDRFEPLPAPAAPAGALAPDAVPNPKKIDGDEPDPGNEPDPSE